MECEVVGYGKVPVGAEFQYFGGGGKRYIKLNNDLGSALHPNARCISHGYDTHFKFNEKTTFYVKRDNMLGSKDISTESWREYDFGGRVYRIENPKYLYVGETTHRVVDDKGVVHCVPAPGQSGCVLRWQTKDKATPVNFRIK